MKRTEATLIQVTKSERQKREVLSRNESTYTSKLMPKIGGARTLNQSLDYKIDYSWR